MKSPRFLYQAVPNAVRGSVKAALNSVLRPVGLEINSTLKQRIEDGRLHKLQSAGHWKTQKYAAGLAIDEKKSLRFLSDTCRPFRANYSRFPISSNGGNTGYFLKNGWFESVDAEMLYSVLRRFEPVRVVEVG